MLESLSYWFFVTFDGKTYSQTIFIILFRLWFWVPLLLLFLRYIVLEAWLISRQMRFMKKQKYLLLAMDVPRKNEQSIQGMELALVHILGAHASINFYEKWIEGVLQLSMSMEIVSIDGFLQLIIRCPVSWRDLVESSIYAQYPDAEIAQVEDYVNTVPSVYPNPTHNMWGVEWVADNNTCFPMRTYTEFEDKLAGLFVDPLAGLLEAMSKIGKGEQIWFQILAKPLGVDWVKSCQALVDKMTGAEKEVKKTGINKVLNVAEGLISELGAAAFNAPIFGAGEEKKKEKDAFGAIWKMSPGDRENLELLQKKMRKLAYSVKMRYGYFGEHAVFSKPKGVQPIIGAVKQFNALGRNGFKPNMKHIATKAAYFNIKNRVAFKQKKLVHGLKKRDGSIGMKPMILNVEELATIYHFPSMLIKAPMLKRTELVRREGPSNLPFEDLPSDDMFGLPEEQFSGKRLPSIPAGGEQVTVPDQAVIESPSYTFDYDSDEFEKRFAVNKEEFIQRDAVKKELESEHKAEVLWSSFGPKRFDYGTAASLPVSPKLQQVKEPSSEETKVEILDSFVGTKILKNPEAIKVDPEAVFPAKTKPVSTTSIIHSVKAKVKRYDEEKDLPENLPFVE